MSRSSPQTTTRHNPGKSTVDPGLPSLCRPIGRTFFYDPFGKARPNEAHLALARWEAAGTLKTLITQNIDNRHREAGIQ